MHLCVVELIFCRNAGVSHKKTGATLDRCSGPFSLLSGRTYLLWLSADGFDLDLRDFRQCLDLVCCRQTKEHAA